MHVLYLTRWYPNKLESMYGLFVERHALAVTKFCKVSVLYIQADEHSNRLYETEYKPENNINVLRVYYKKSIHNSVLSSSVNTFRYLKSNFIGYNFLVKHAGKPDLIHVNVLTRTGLLALYLKKYRGIPYLITEHWSRYLPITNTYKGFFRKVITRLIVKNASAVTTVSEDLMKAMLKHKLNNGHYYVIPNVVDTSLFVPKTNSELRTTNSELIKISHISCFEDKSKNISGILRVINRLSEIRQDFELRLIGEGIDRIKLEKYAEELGVKGKYVIFDGLLRGDTLTRAIQSSDFVLLFSNYENQPVVLLESFACGIPVLSSDVGGISEIVNKENGMLVRAGDETELLNGLIKMMDICRKYNKEKIREFAVDNFSMDKVEKQFADIYNNILNK